MFAPVKKSGKYQYLQIVENRKEKGKVRQRVIDTVGRLDHLHEKNRVETLVRSLARFSEKALLIISGTADVSAQAVKIGPSLIFERLWHKLGIGRIIITLLNGRKFQFDVKRTIFLTVLHRLFSPGSDRFGNTWRRDYLIKGVEEIALHHVYRAMAFLGEALANQNDATPFSPRCVKDLIEERLFAEHRCLFTELELVFFDTTSIYFEGEGGETLGHYGHSKDNRGDLKQMVVGALLDDNGRPICCEIWPGNTADVTTLMPVVERIRKRFYVGGFSIVADRGMISNDTIKALESPDCNVSYILGARMRRVKEIHTDVLSRVGRYRDVYPESSRATAPAPLMVKEVWVEDRCYIVCHNVRQARKDAAARQAIVDTLQYQIRTNPKRLVNNRGYRKFLKINTGSVTLDQKKIKADSRFDGMWVLRTYMDLPAEKIALKYKELWQVEQVYRDVKSVLHTRPIFHKCDETIRGHVFCSFLALVLRKEFDSRLQKAGLEYEWAAIKQDLKALQEVEIEENGKKLCDWTQSVEVCGNVFKAVGVAMPPTIREQGHLLILTLNAQHLSEYLTSDIRIFCRRPPRACVA
jgi:transposase